MSNHCKKFYNKDTQSNYKEIKVSPFIAATSFRITTFRITTLSIMTLYTWGLFATFSKNNTQK